MKFEEWREKNLDKLHREFWENNKRELEKYIEDEFENYEIEESQNIKLKMKKYKIIDIYGDEFIYNCENKEEAIECFNAENGKERFSEVLE